MRSTRVVTAAAGVPSDGAPRLEKLAEMSLDVARG